MATTTVMTSWGPLRKCRSVNQTSTSFVAKVPKAAEPVVDAASATGEATIDMRNGGSLSQNGLIILPYGLHASITNNLTFSMRVIGWRRFGDDSTTYIWIPVKLLEVLCTVSSTLVGLAGKTIIATEMFADTITLVGTSGNANVSHELVSPADDTLGHIVVDTKGYEKIELSFSTGSSVTSANALVATI